MSIQCCVCSSYIRDDNFITCKNCENKSHLDCAKNENKSKVLRSAKRFNPMAWLCVVCKDKKGEESSDNSDAGDDNTDIKKVLNELVIIKNNQNELMKTKDKIEEIQSSLEFICKQYDVMLEKQSKQEKLIKDLKVSIVKLTDLNKEKDEQIVFLNNKINELDQHQYSMDVEIHGVEVREDENVRDIVKNAADVLKLNNTLSNISDIYRIPTKRDTSVYSPPIVLTFKSRDAREQWLNRKVTRTLKSGLILKDNSNKNIFVNERLSFFLKQLLWQTKQRAKDKDYKFVWVKNGKIFIRKNENHGIARIQNEDDLLQRVV